MTIRRLILSCTVLAVTAPLGLLLYERRLAAAQAGAGILRTRAIELADARGQVRAQLDVEPDGEVVFRLRDARDTIGVKLGASD
jgi:hypothetical protein